MATPTSEFPELGFYALPGHTRTPADLLDEVRAAEALGVGSAWLSERFDVKEVAALAGAAGAVTDKLVIGTGATNINSRHPMLTATMASTLHRLTHGRFALGVARGVGIRYDLMGMEKVTNAHLSEFADMMRKLWRGERVSHNGKLGNYPYLHMNDWLDEDIPLMFVGFGPKSLRFAGSLFDGVILHTFLSDQALKKAVACVREGAENAGRDPDAVKVWSVLATACDADEATYLKYIVARMATYLQAPNYGELLVDINGWDRATLDAFRADKVVSKMPGGIDSVASTEQLRHIRDLLPESWLPAAVGSAEDCAQRFNDQFEAGADGIIIHASQPHEFAPVLEAYRKVRDKSRFTDRTNRPC
ncbi:TIGR03857 family LLM class F420-dependent oxidoreductase [Litorivivens sp.]|uniref:TIGR03857 family LLM class F420-dependent oxidoreductase n=1 Tax=Litorivivens sp. TaxID=2020868 RepID=UPI0035659658